MMLAVSTLTLVALWLALCAVFREGLRARAVKDDAVLYRDRLVRVRVLTARCGVLAFVTVVAAYAEVFPGLLATPSYLPLVAILLFLLHLRAEEHLEAAEQQVRFARIDAVHRARESASV